MPFLGSRCSDPDDDSWIEAVALAGDRAAWIRLSQPGTHINFFVETATTRAPRIRVVSPHVDGESDWATSGGDGTYATDIVGNGNLIALNVWTSCIAVQDGPNPPECPERLQRLSKSYWAIESAALLRVTVGGLRLRRVVPGVQALYEASVDAGRILVLHTKQTNFTGWGSDYWFSAADGSLAIYRSDGHLLQTIQPTSAAIRDARLQGNDPELAVANGNERAREGLKRSVHMTAWSAFRPTFSVWLVPVIWP